MHGPDPDATGPQIIDIADTEPAEIEGDAAILKLCRDVLSPLVSADGGLMYVVKATHEEVHVHLTGTCAGCPGASLTRDGVIAPAIRTVSQKARVVVTTGPRVPEGAKRI